MDRCHLILLQLWRPKGLICINTRLVWIKTMEKKQLLFLIL